MIPTDEAAIADVIVKAVRSATAGLSRDVATLTERVTALDGVVRQRDSEIIELRAALVEVTQLAKEPGPAGAPGRDGLTGQPGRDGERGAPGLDGKDGAPGRDGVDGIAGKDGTPGMTYRGVYAAGTGYEKGDTVTYAGSTWIAREATSEKPGDGATAWQLAVKAGREGRQGPIGPTGERGPKGESGPPGRDYR